MRNLIVRPEEEDERDKMVADLFLLAEHFSLAVSALTKFGATPEVISSLGVDLEKVLDSGVSEGAFKDAEAYLSGVGYDIPNEAKQPTIN